MNLFIRSLAMMMLMIMVSSCSPDVEVQPEQEAEIPSEMVNNDGLKDDILDTSGSTEDEQEADQDPLIKDTDTEPMNVPEDEATIPIDYQGLGVNELGHIMVVMYHGIKDQPPYHRTKEDFIKDLTYMYDHNYRLITMKDYLKGTIDLPLGMTPIVLTFDDGLATTFSLVEEEGVLKVNPDSAIGLIEAFSLEHPDFGKTASLYIHDTRSNFRGAGDDVDRLNWLLDHGYELGNHSATHENFKHLSADQLVKEIGQVDEYVREVIPELQLFALTYPYGARPEEANVHLLQDGVYKTFELKYQVAFREGPSSKFYPPLHQKFDPLNAPRVRGSEGQVQDLWWFFEQYETHPELKYVSDGQPDTLVIPSQYRDELKENVQLSEDMTIITYERSE